MNILRANQLKTTHWSGGKTTELFIYPPNSSYADRNFDFRFSTATVEVDESDFTHLPGVFRHLMILEGKLELSHNQQPFFTLHPFEQDQFPGDWHSNSKGKVTDLNLMLIGSYSGTLSVIQLAAGKSHQLTKNSSSHVLLYVKVGSVSIASETMHVGDVAILSPHTISEVALTATEDSLILMAVVN